MASTRCPQTRSPCLSWPRRGRLPRGARSCRVGPGGDIHSSPCLLVLAGRAVHQSLVPDAAMCCHTQTPTWLVCPFSLCAPPELTLCARRLLRPPGVVRLLVWLLRAPVVLGGPERARHLVPLHLPRLLLLGLQRPPRQLLRLGRSGLLRPQVRGRGWCRGTAGCGHARGGQGWEGWGGTWYCRRAAAI